MRVSCVLVLVAAALAVAQVGLAHDGVDDADVKQLTESNFDSVVSGEISLVAFTAPWCGHCKKLAPEFARAATRLLKNDPPVILANVDATENRELASRFGVSGYPTLKVFRNGEESAYNGPRDEDGIVKFMKKQTGPAARPVKTVAEVEALVNNGEDFYFVLGLFSQKASKLRTAFTRAANAMRDDVVFIISESEDVRAAYAAGDDGGDVPDEAMVAVRPKAASGKEERVVFDGSTATSEVKSWVTAQSLPLVGLLSRATAESYQKRGLPVAKLYVSNADFVGNAQQMRYYVNRLKTPAAAHGDQLVFAIGDRDEFADDLKRDSLDGRELVFIIDENKWKGEKFLLHEKFSKQAVIDFVDRYLDGDAEKFVRSEEPPKDNSGPVKVVTGRTFDELVEDDSKDVLIEFYAPWCGHCKALTPKYEKLGKKLAKEENVVIAKLDATANDFNRERYEVKGYPTLYFKPAKAGAKPRKYEGAREVKDMHEYIMDNAKTVSKSSKKGRRRRRRRRRRR